MKYIIELSVKWNNVLQLVSYKEEKDVLSFVSQLQRWIVSINWKILKSDIESLEYFKITEQNYDQKDDDWRCHYITPLEDGDVDIEECLNPYKKDITNKILNKRVVSSNKKWNIYLHKFTMSILWEYFPLQKNTKIREVFEILIISKYRYQSNDISYEQMEVVFSEWDFKKISIKDFNYEKMRDILKDKLKDFNRELGVDVLKLHISGVKINI